jgi:integrase
MRRLRCCLGDAMEMNSNLPKSWDHKSLSLIDRSMDKDLITPSFRVGRDGDSKVVIVQTARAGRIHSFRYPPIQIIVDAERMERSLTDIPNISQKGTRLGNWLTREQAKDLLTVPERSTLKGKRDYVILARLVGWRPAAERAGRARRRDHAAARGTMGLGRPRGQRPTYPHRRHPDLGQAGNQRLDDCGGNRRWTLLRSVSKSGKVNRDTLSDWTVWSVVEQSSKQIGIEHFGAHDLRRTCAKLCRKSGGDLEQIKFLLGHSSIQTTERYLGSDQEIVVAVNDNLGL